jgi:iron complex outermembrane receptor protein
MSSTSMSGDGGRRAHERVRIVRRTATVGTLAIAAAAVLGGCARRPAPEASARPAAAAVADDSVSVGYGSVSRRAVTGAVASLDEDDLAKTRVARIEDALTGRVAGLEVQRTPSGVLRLRVRGASSFNGSTEPLLVIDGMPIAGGASSGALDGLQPSDIARVSVLKDAEAAIYGSQGANGVVLINTKRGKRRAGSE